MSYSLDIQKLIHDVRDGKGLTALTAEFEKISKEVTRLKSSIKPDAQAKLKQLEGQSKEVLKKLTAIQKELDVTLKKVTTEAEKNINKYRSLVLQQKSKIQVILKGKGKKATAKKSAGTKARKPRAAKKQA